MSAYLSMEIEDCRARGHRFDTAWSDKTPMKVNLVCVTCTEANPGKTAYVAYGTSVGSFGLWRKKNKDEESAR